MGTYLGIKRSKLVKREVHSVAVALGMLVLGTARMDRFMEWWLGRPLPYVRLWASGAITFGAIDLTRARELRQLVPTE